MIDIHTHLTKSSDVTDPRVRSFFERNGVELAPERPVARLLEEMDRGGIDKAVVVGSPPGAGIRIDNADLAAALKPHEDRLIGFGVADPASTSDLAGELRRCVEVYGFRGVGEFGLRDITDPVCFPVYETCIELGIPLLVHQGTTLPSAPIKYGHPGLLDEVVIRYPELTVIAAHCGAPWCAELAAVAVRHPNVWIDVSALLAYPHPVRLQALGTMLAGGLGERLLFGSDFPVTSPADAAAWLRSFQVPLVGRLALKIPRLTDDQRHGMMHGNAERLLGRAARAGS